MSGSSPEPDIGLLPAGSEIVPSPRETPPLKMTQPAVRSAFPPRALPLPPPRVLVTYSSAAMISSRVLSPADIRAEYAELSAECARRGPGRIFGPRDPSDFLLPLSVPLLALSMLVVGVTAVVCANYAKSEAGSVVGRKAAEIVPTALGTVAIPGRIAIVMVQQYVGMSQSAVWIGLSTLSTLPWFCTMILGRFIQSSNVVWQVSAQIGFILGYSLVWEIGRVWWRHEKSRANVDERLRCTLRRFICRGSVFHTAAYVLLIGDAATALYMIYSGNAVPYNVVTVLMVIAVSVAILWSISRFGGMPNWSAGHAIMLGIFMNSQESFASLVDGIFGTYVADNGMINSLVRLLLVYVLFGFLFSITHTLASLSTMSYHSPQYVSMYQAFLEQYLGIIYASTNDRATFCSMLFLQSLWVIIRNTGLQSYLYFIAKDRAMLMVTGRKPQHSAEEMLTRENYFFLLNCQSLMFEIINAVVIPLMAVVDYYLPWDRCTLLCSMGKSSASRFLSNYGIVLCLRIVTGIAVLGTYSLRFTAMATGWGGITVSSLWKTLKSFFTAFSLQIWRNFPFYVLASNYAFTSYFFDALMRDSSDSSSASTA